MSGNMNSTSGGEVKDWPVITNLPGDQAWNKLHSVAPAAAPGTDPTNLEQTLKSLVSLAGLMKTMTADAAPGTAPLLILTSSGLELRFPGATGNAATETPAPDASNDRLAKIERNMKLISARLDSMELQPGGSLDWFTRIEQGLNSVRQASMTLNQSLSLSINEVESQLRAHSATVESLKSAVKQNEEMIESLVDSMNLIEDLAAPLPELVYSKSSLAS
jgi:hypothetical protein